ncbi:MAG: alkaline phytoceramidase [Proteobacteria bacterium]|nr:alkaline phytoceramidase [Pseudomonadota bacterium]NOG58998.1 alkaline phytoceramidase [Pseudomonadota bacterium]
MKTTKEKIGVLLILCFGMIVVVSFFIVPPIAQDTMYHQFSDNSTYLEIPNTSNVLSNFFFLVAGCLGFLTVLKNKDLNILYENKAAYITLFLSAVLVSVGSGYYHLYPSNDTLVWDRLPMTIAFMSLFSIVISEFVSIKIGKAILLPMILVGILSVIYWYITEMSGKGDLRPYVAVQFFPIVAIPVMLIMFTSVFDKSGHYWWLLVTYILAKLFEHYDFVIHDILLVISGHSLKHISAAIGLFILIKGYRTIETLPRHTE